MIGKKLPNIPEQQRRMRHKSNQSSHNGYRAASLSSQAGRQNTTNARRDRETVYSVRVSDSSRQIKSQYCLATSLSRVRQRKRWQSENNICLIENPRVQAKSRERWIQCYFSISHQSENKRDQAKSREREISPEQISTTRNILANIYTGVGRESEWGEKNHTMHVQKCKSTRIPTIENIANPCALE